MAFDLHVRFVNTAVGRYFCLCHAWQFNVISRLRKTVLKLFMNPQLL